MANTKDKFDELEKGMGLVKDVVHKMQTGLGDKLCMIVLWKRQTQAYCSYGTPTTGAPPTSSAGLEYGVGVALLSTNVGPPLRWICASASPLWICSFQMGN
ncbi:unnamed protein product [Arabidopsis lyrata]|uniref:Predicted protein n=1 Tax=Arabidopsis lyrata subsp. lyrata TaxID=81972 RepID=D7LPS2_ARALL|nr:predicted protein [Arabidopsis lyrata subsp. lyrata]CAH8267038.1 unnamed protein product [Arabidopsis lyrata]